MINLDFLYKISRSEVNFKIKFGVWYFWKSPGFWRLCRTAQRTGKKKKSRSIWQWFDVWIICLALQNIVMLLCTCFISLVGSSRAWTMGLCQTYYDTTDCYSLSKPRGKSFTGTDCAWCCLFLNAGKGQGQNSCSLLEMLKFLQTPFIYALPPTSFYHVHNIFKYLPMLFYLYRWLYLIEIILTFHNLMLY